MELQDSMLKKKVKKRDKLTTITQKIFR